MNSARDFDTNGWFEVKKNPISKSGVFPYLGKSIPITGLDPTKFYNVYRPAEELNSQETIDSFKLLPWVDDHAMIGPHEDTPAEEKGIHGVTGEDVFFEEPYLYSNLKCFSEKLAQKIESGKQELSIGYNCKWFIEDGVFEGTPYSIVQRVIRGNHLASVREARSGRDMAVLDEAEKLDEVPKMEENGQQKEEGLTLAHLKECIEQLPEKIAAAIAGKASSQAQDQYENKDMPKEEPVQDASEKKDDDKKDEGKAMDEAELTKKIFVDISRRDALARRAAKDERVGTFDASEMTLEETAKYVVKKLGLNCPKGHENSVLAGYFAAATVSKPVVTGQTQAAMDSNDIESPQLRKFVHGEG